MSVMGEENSPGSEEQETQQVEDNQDNLGDNSQGEEDALHPGWNEMLEVLPSSLHSIVTPHLRARDKNYQDGIQKVHSQYETYKPYLENNIPPDRINYALQVAQAIEERPQDMIKALQEFTGMSKAEATQVVADQQSQNEPGQVDSDVPEELLNHPKFQEMEKQLQTVAQYLVTQKQTEEQRAQDEQLETELAGLRDKNGEFDEEFVLRWAIDHPNASLEDGVKAYKDFVNKILEENRRAPAPKVLPGGGANVSSEISREDMKDPKSRKSIVQQMLQQAKS
jgi:polyhydroxyalkanoate synthesis regulator phasin